MEPIPGDLFACNPPGLTAVLEACTVGIAGAGGIGSNVAVLLTRAGMGGLVVADFDIVEISNLNRQFYFLDQVGRSKVPALRANLARINPALHFHAVEARLTPENACEPFAGCDVLIEAVDAGETKVAVIETWMRNMPGVHVFSCSGVSGHGNTDAIRVDRRAGLTIVGDQTSDPSQGTLSSRIALVAAMIANEVIEHLLENSR